MQLLVIVSLLLVALISAGAAVRRPGDDIQSNVSYELVGTGPYGSRLFNILSSSVYDDPPLLIDLTAATAYQQGFDVGSLLGHQWVSNFNTLMVYLLGDQWSVDVDVEIESLSTDDNNCPYPLCLSLGTNPFWLDV